MSEREIQHCLELVRQDGLAIEHIVDPTEEICLEAVRKSPWAIQFIQDQTEELCLEAVTRCGVALGAVRDKKRSICLAAMLLLLQHCPYRKQFHAADLSAFLYTVRIRDLTA